MVRKKKKKKDIPEPNEMEILERNRKHYSWLIKYYSKEKVKINHKIETYKKVRDEIENKIKTYKTRKEKNN